MNRMLTAFILTVVTFSGDLPRATAVYAGTIDPLLEEAMRNSDGLFHVDFVMASQFDLNTLDLEGLTRTERRRRIIEALQTHARVTQADMLAYMQAPPPGQTILNVGSTWLVNAVWALVDVPAIRVLAAREDVGYAFLDVPGPPWPAPVAPSTWGALNSRHAFSHENPSMQRTCSALRSTASPKSQNRVGALDPRYSRHIRRGSAAPLARRLTRSPQPGALRQGACRDGAGSASRSIVKRRFTAGSPPAHQRIQNGLPSRLSTTCHSVRAVASSSFCWTECRLHPPSSCFSLLLLLISFANQLPRHSSHNYHPPS